MKRIWTVVVVGLAMAACAAVLGIATTYAVYYDCSSGRETVLTIMNAEPMEIEYTLSLFRPIGGRISGVAGAINPYASVEYVVSELLPAGWAAEACGGPNRAPNKGLLALCKGGLALLETSGSVLVKVAFADEGGPLVSVDINQAVPEEREHGNYWYAVSYEHSASRSTRLSVVNPYDERITFSVSVYDEDGNLLFFDSSVPMQYEAATYDVADYLGDQGSASGIIDILSKFPVVVAVEYMDGDGVLLSMEQTAHFHFFLD